MKHFRLKFSRGLHLVTVGLGVFPDAEFWNHLVWVTRNPDWVAWLFETIGKNQDSVVRAQGATKPPYYLDISDIPF